MDVPRPPGRRTRVLLCGDRRLLVQLLGSSLGLHGFDVVAMSTVPDGIDGIDGAVVDRDPDVCLLDVTHPAGRGMDAVARISSGTRARVLVLSARSDPEIVEAAVRAGASGFVSMDQRFDDILRALDRLARGEIALPVVPGQVAAAMLPPRDRQAEIELLRFLTGREREALRRIAAGQSTKEIARSMHVAYSTARTHVQNVLTKLGVRSRLQAAALVARAGLLAELGDGPAPDDLATVTAPASANGSRSAAANGGGVDGPDRERCRS